MKVFSCDQCGHPAFFENTRCERCGATLGYLAESIEMAAVTPCDADWESPRLGGRRFRFCANFRHGACNWLIPAGSGSLYCRACELNEMVPDLGNPWHLAAWRSVEAAKHRLVYGLLRFQLPLENRARDPERGLGFRFLAEGGEPVMTGHRNGIITVNIAEADPALREAVRQDLGERYRTLIGHFRHESGHYYWERLVRDDPPSVTAFREQFGDERTDYAEALRRHHDDGPPGNWPDRYISAYAGVHPWEDWAETWAHYFHLVDILETGGAFRISTRPGFDRSGTLAVTIDFDAYEEPDFERLYDAFLGLNFAVNSLNRGMGQPDLYPFVVSSAVKEKLRFVHAFLRAGRG